MKVLISDNLAEVGEKILKDAGLEVDVITGLEPEELKKIIGNYDGLVIRSATKVTASIIESADKLKIVGRAGIGLDNVDIPEASKRGIVVMNAPDGNAITAAEHAIAMMMSLTRNIPQATARLKEGGWDKKKFQGREVTGKTLGIIGIGRIGAIAADRAQGLRMKVMAFDPYMPQEVAEKLGIELVSLEELCKRADYFTVHVPLTKETANLISDAEFKLMKPEAMFIDCARGGVVDEEALYRALKDGQIRGAALDVFASEPTTLEGTPLLSLPNFICTPHLGASTSEAQVNVAVTICEQMADFLNNGTVANAVNVPSVSADVIAKVGPYADLAERMGAMHMELAEGGIEEVTIEFDGDLAEMTTTPVTVAFLKGLFTPILKEAVNYVNAPMIAKERGIKIVEAKTSDADAFTSLLTVKIKSENGVNEISGTVFGKKEPRIVRINSFRLEAEPVGAMLFVANDDVPGVIGALGVTLGKLGVNISKMTVGQEVSGDSSRNVILLNTDKLLDKKQLAEILALDHITDARVLEV